MEKREVCKSKISVLLKMTITIIDLNLVPFAIPLQLKTGPVERRSLGVLVGEVVFDLCTRAGVKILAIFSSQVAETLDPEKLQEYRDIFSFFDRFIFEVRRA